MMLVLTLWTDNAKIWMNFMSKESNYEENYNFSLGDCPSVFSLRM